MQAKGEKMSFDQVPNEQAQISGADFAIMCDEIRQLKAENIALKLSLEFQQQKAE
jgi:hypothetical protein